MRVLRVLTRANGGGPARHLGALERELRRLGVETRFLVGRCRPDEVDWTERLREDGADPVPVPALRPTASPPEVLKASRAVGRHIRAFRPDVVHSHTAVAGAAARLAVAPGSAAVVHTFHGHTLQGGYWSRPGAFLVRAVERWLARRSDVLVAVAGRVQAELERAGLRPRRGWAVIPPAPEPGPPGPSRAEARAGLDLPEGSPVLLFAGRLERVKGLDLLLEALGPRGAGEGAAGVGGILDACLLLVCGAGREESRLRRLAAPLGERVRFLGWRQDLSLPLAAADLAVLPSRNEGWPLLLADAAAAGLPVVAADVGGCSEAVNLLGHGILVPPGEPTALGEAIGTLLGQEQRLRELGEAGRARAGRILTPAEAARRHLTLYEGIWPA